MSSSVHLFLLIAIGNLVTAFVGAQNTSSATSLPISHPPGLFSKVDISSPAPTDERVDQPTKNFEQLWELTKAHYCNFDLLPINWDSLYYRYRKQLSDSTTNEELFEICGNLLKELDDRHVSIYRKGNFHPSKVQCAQEGRFLSEYQTMEDIFLFHSVTDSLLQSEGFSSIDTLISDRNGLGINVGRAASDSFVYLQINGFGASNRKIKHIMKATIEALQSRNGLIIDLRLNGGGLENKAFLFASFLAKRQQTALYKHNRIPYSDRYTAIEKMTIDPIKGLKYTGRVVILTSDFTVSAAGVFVLALSRVENVTIIGDRTAGFFSDYSTFKLPNGWKFTLSTQKYYSPEMKNYERVGIPPDYLILNTLESTRNGKDPVLMKALEVLQQKRDFKN